MMGIEDNKLTDYLVEVVLQIHIFLRNLVLFKRRYFLLNFDHCGVYSVENFSTLLLSDTLIMFWFFDVQYTFHLLTNFKI